MIRVFNIFRQAIRINGVLIPAGKSHDFDNITIDNPEITRYRMNGNIKVAVINTENTLNKTLNGRTEVVNASEVSNEIKSEEVIEEVTAKESNKKKRRTKNNE